MKEIIATAIIGAILFGIIMLDNSIGCSSQWDDNKTKYDLIGGCKVQGEDGKWSPEKNFRAN